MEYYTALEVTETEGEFKQQIVELPLETLPEGDLLIRVHYSSLNYKDMLSATGHAGITKSYPHTPGIDAAGVVVESRSGQFRPGDEVIVTGFDLGCNTRGGLGQLIRVPASWAVSLPKSMSLMESMAYGTAGLTAALCVDSLMQVGITPSQGEVLVTGATGGVGSIAIMLLAKLNFDIIAATGKANDASEYLQELGVKEIINRSELEGVQQKGLLSERWLGAVDTVGGEILMNVLKSVRYGGSVACCGMASSPYFSGNVFPFILRGVNLLGVDSSHLPMEVRLQMWESLCHEWKLKQLESIVQVVPLEKLPELIDQLKAGQILGRIVVDLRD